jgi:hypothetical protein
MALSPSDFRNSPPGGYGLVRPHCDGSLLLGCLSLLLRSKEPLRLVWFTCGFWLAGAGIPTHAVSVMASCSTLAGKNWAACWAFGWTPNPPSFVLGLDRLRVVRLSAAYQDVFIHADGASGHYFNVAEMSAGAWSAPHTVNMQVFSYRTLCLVDWTCSAVGSISWFERGGHTKATRSYPTVLKLAAFRLSFHKEGWQSILYPDDDLRIVRANEGGLFILMSGTPIRRNSAS